VKQGAYFPQSECKAWKQNNAATEMKMETTMNTLEHTEGHEGMNTRLVRLFGLAAVGLALAAPVQAAPNRMEGAFIVAKRDQANEVRPDQRDTRKDTRPAPRRETKPEDQEGYGYGYERRRQQQHPDEDRQPRDRR
jgi:hypothetical protein